MIAKLIVTGRDRREAMQRTLQALHQTQVAGVHLNLAFLDRILSHAEFQSGAMTTQFIGQHFPEGLTERRAKAPEGDHLRRLVFENLKAQQALGQPTSFAAATPISSSGWPRFVRHSSGEWTCRRGNQLWVMSAAESTLVSLASGALDASRTGAATGQVVAPMPGKIVKVLSKPGQTVEPNQTLLVMEAMKMEYTIKAPLRAQLEKIRVTEGQMVALGEQLADLKPLKER
jgi:3-methylcrotonyl-CoA carboxylase alpha subunit